MIDRKHDLPITKQAQVLRISRGSVYYLARSVSAPDLHVMRSLDRLHLEFPFAGSLMLRGLLCKMRSTPRTQQSRWMPTWVRPEVAQIVPWQLAPCAPELRLLRYLGSLATRMCPRH